MNARPAYRAYVVSQWRKAVRDDPAVSSMAKLAAFVVGEYMTSAGLTGHDPQHPAPSKARLARGMSCSKRTADKYIGELVRAGYLAVEASPGRVPHRYEALLRTVQSAAPLNLAQGCTVEQANRANEAAQPCNTDPSTVQPAAPEVEEVDEVDDDVARASEEELLHLLQQLGSPLTPAQFETVRTAWRRAPHGVRALIREASTARVNSKVGLFLSRINAGAHLEVKADPPQRPLEVCETCGNSFEHSPSCPRAPQQDPRRAGICPECEMGGGYHVEGCTRVANGARRAARETPILAKAKVTGGGSLDPRLGRKCAQGTLRQNPPRFGELRGAGWRSSWAGR